MPSSKRRRTSGSTRRKLLLKLGGGAAVIAGFWGVITPSGAFTTVTGDRVADIRVSEDNGLIGIDGKGPVDKNKRGAMVAFTNNGAETMTITVTLDNPGDGTLYDNNGVSGSLVTVMVAPGNTQNVDIEASVTGTVSYGISASSPSLSIDTSGSVESQPGNNPGAIRSQKPKQNQNFTADRAGSKFTVDQVDIRDNDNDDDLNRIEFRIKEGGSGGTVIASLNVTNPPGDRYNPNANPAVTIQPNSGYTIKAGTTYALTVTAIDDDGNTATETVEDTTGGTQPGTQTQTPTPGGCTIGSSNNPGAFQFQSSNLQGFDPKQGPDRWDIGQIQFQDNDGDNDLATLKLEITDSSNTVQATDDLSSQVSGQQYQGQNLKINPDDPNYDVQKNESYTLTVTVCDDDGNSITRTEQATA